MIYQNILTRISSIDFRSRKTKKIDQWLHQQLLLLMLYRLPAMIGQAMAVVCLFAARARADDDPDDGDVYAVSLHHCNIHSISRIVVVRYDPVSWPERPPAASCG